MQTGHSQLKIKLLNKWCFLRSQLRLIVLNRETNHIWFFVQFGTISLISKIRKTFLWSSVIVIKYGNHFPANQLTLTQLHIFFYFVMRPVILISIITNVILSKIEVTFETFAIDIAPPLVCWKASCSFYIGIPPLHFYYPLRTLDLSGAFH